LNPTVPELWNFLAAYREFVLVILGIGGGGQVIQFHESHRTKSREFAGDLKFKTGGKMKHAQPGQLRVWAGQF
jgi:hypothetical protein